MSDFITPIKQQPKPCDFGPFAGGYCGKVVTIDFNQATSSIQIADIELELFENSIATIDLSDLVISAMEIDWSKTIFAEITLGTITFNQTTKELTFTPDQTPSVDRIATFTFQVFDSFDYSATGTIKINIIDKTPILRVENVSLSGNEGQTFTIDTRTKTVVENTTINYLNASSVVISVLPSEGTATVENGIITYIPSQVPATNRTVTFKYKVKDITTLEAEATISISLTDITPALTTSNITKSVLDSASLTASILGNITIKNDTFKLLRFGTPSEGTISVNGSNYTFTPSNTVKTNRVVIIPYTVETTTGLTSTSNLTINITYDNLWAGTFWYGNNTKENLVKEDIETLTSTKKTNYIGTYNIAAGTGTYKWFVYPKAWGENPTILDASNNMPIATDDYKNLTVEGVDLILIRSYYTLNGSISIKFS